MLPLVTSLPREFPGNELKIAVKKLRSGNLLYNQYAIVPPTAHGVASQLSMRYPFANNGPYS